MNSQHKNTFFSLKKNINCGGKLISFEKPLVMGILNLTPDSFYDGGKYEKNKINIHFDPVCTSNICPKNCG